MKQNGELQGTDRLYFPSEVSFRPCNEGWLVVAVSTANWLVLPNDFQKTLLQHLIKGETIGEVFQLITTDEQLGDFKRLLAAITARSFALTTQPPQPSYHEGYRMLNIYLTNACNLRCPHCFMRSGQPLANELPTDEWLRILSEFKAEGGESEPLMNRDFETILTHAHQIGLSTTILSNGILWTEEQITRLSPSISEIQISIDGFDESSNAKIRGIGHFDRVVHNVILMANSGIRTSVATTFTFQNLQDDTPECYAQMVRDIKSQCQHPVFFKLSKKILQGRETHYTDAENHEFYNRIIDIENQVDPNAKYANFMEGHTPNQADRNCGFGGISIGADGEVYYCNRILYGERPSAPLADFGRLLAPL